MTLLLAAFLMTPEAFGQTASAWTVSWDPLDLASSSAAGCLDEINPFAFALKEGRGVVLAHRSLLEETVRPRLWIPVVVNDVVSENGPPALKSPEALAAILSSDDRAAAHVEELVALTVEGGFDGIEIDYERIPGRLWGKFAEFIARLGRALHDRGKLLELDVEAAPLYWGDRTIAPLFWPALASSADAVKLMCYYQRGSLAAPGPVNSLDWVRDTARGALKYIPPEKLVLALSSAGMDWGAPLAPAKRLPYGQVQNLLAQNGARVRWDKASASPYLEYDAAGTRHRLWFENERSLAEKIKAVREAGVRRIALWYLGRRHPDLNSLGLCRR